jgi:hypothetical protein
MSPQDAARSTTVIVINYTDTPMTFQGSTLDHGIWSDDLSPPQEIPTSGGTVTWANESDGFMTGDEGSATYWLFPNSDQATTGTIYWNNPYSGSNTYSITFEGPSASNFIGSYDGGSGDNATVTFEVRSK